MQNYLSQRPNRRRVVMRSTLRSRSRKSRGFTLVELLVTMAVTLLLIFALAQAFAVVGEAVATGRATIEMSGNLRSVANRLQKDLDGLTVTVQPWIDNNVASGYFEYIDGPGTDRAPISNSTADLDADTMYGDFDDILAFTSQSTDVPFVGMVNGTVEQSNFAEIIWWIQYNDLDGDEEFDPVDGEKLTIYRRTLLILPAEGTVFERSVANSNAYDASNQASLAQMRADLHDFYSENDISVRVRWQRSGNNVEIWLTANSLSDLTNRFNRFARNPSLSDQNPTPPELQLPGSSGLAAVVPYASMSAAEYASTNNRSNLFPYPIDVNRRSVTCLYRLSKSIQDQNAVSYSRIPTGEDVMVSDALAFDVQAYDAEARVVVDSNVGPEPMVPDNPGYDVEDVETNASNITVVGYGAFVDLGYSDRKNRNYISIFSEEPTTGSQLGAGLPMWPTQRHTAGRMYTYCTWPTLYERDGIDQDADSGIDEGTDGFDTDNANGVDDVAERETSPPYADVLPSIRVRIRAYEPDTRQVRQATVVSNFVPE